MLPPSWTECIESREILYLLVSTEGTAPDAQPARRPSLTLGEKGPPLPPVPVEGSRMPNGQKSSRDGSWELEGLNPTNVTCNKLVRFS